VKVNALLALATIIILSSVPVCAAQGRHSVSTTLVYQPPASLESGGEVTVTRARLQTKGRLFKTKKLFANWSLGINLTDYDFRGAANEPWGDIYRADFSVPILRPINREWTLLISPGINASGEADAEAEKSLSYGLFTALNWQSGENLRLGVGVVGSLNLEEEQVFPVIIVDWQLSPTWRLANPLRAGVTGPAGLELSWTPAENWTLATGGATRSFRFRLSPDNPVSNGIGEEEIVPVWLRLSRDWDQNQLAFYAGATLDGHLKIEDRDGKVLRSSDYEDVPFFALYFSGSF
jgi:hypothetical protein